MGNPQDGMQRYAACVEYCGVRYAGWQRQKHAPSVQEAVERAISRVADCRVGVVAAGRTDTGVHGSGQILHFDTPNLREEVSWLRGVNTWLPDDISLLWTRPVEGEFHARHKALERHYRYVILNREVSPSYLHGRVTWFRWPLDVEAMRAAAGSLLGTHDFSAFRAAGCQSLNPIKELRRLDIGHAGQWIWFDVSADGFLHHMVRNLVGVLCAIGQGEALPGWAAEVLASRDRKQGGVTFPPDGLYFSGADYAPDWRLPPPPPVCRFW
ncbi:MAG: tRNA pseudouridine(38-40) synthase TruA [Gammaproteobacteria bacterium]|nr:tRNA pseudouridine(38-40) synthase TruA [Gammaproteobacteria bacterium]